MDTRQTPKHIFIQPQTLALQTVAADLLATYRCYILEQVIIETEMMPCFEYKTLAAFMQMHYHNRLSI